MYRIYLETVGIEVETASSGKAAVQLAKSGQPDVIVLDLRMPGMDGREAVRLLREHRPTSRIPVILLTGGDAGIDGVGQSGADAALMKPCAPTALLDMIRRFTGRA